MAILKVGRHNVQVTKSDFIFFPKSKITKGDLVDYYYRISDVMLPYLKNRALTMVRYPSGIDKEGFYQKDAPEYFPSWIKRIPIKKHEDGLTHYIVAQNRATIVFIANQGCITPHLWLSKIDKINCPDTLIFDLDPPENASGKVNFALVQQAAFLIKDILHEHGLVPFVKTTGSTGLHVVVPLKRRAGVDFDAVRAYARKIATLAIKQAPKILTLEVHKEKRGNRVFIDTLRNAFGQTAVAPYAVRPRENAPVAMPISWDEAAEKSLTSQRYTIKNVFKHLEKYGDQWQEMNKYAAYIKEFR